MEIKIKSNNTFTITWTVIAAIVLLLTILASCSPIYYTLEGEPVIVKVIGEVPDCDTLIMDNGILVTK